MSLDVAVLWYSAALAQLLLIARLYVTGLHRIYPAFWAYLWAQILHNLAIIPFDAKSHSYAIAWTLSYVLVLISVAAMATEIISKIRADYPNDRRFTLCLTAVAFVVAAACAGSMLSFDWARIAWNKSAFFVFSQTTYVAARLIYMSIAIGLTLLWLSLSWAARLRRDLRAHLCLTVGLCASTAAVFIGSWYAWRNPALSHPLWLIQEASTLVLFVAWNMGMRQDYCYEGPTITDEEYESAITETNRALAFLSGLASRARSIR